jgi:hypothetical protein
MAPTPFDPNLLRMSLAVIFTGMAELFWEKKNPRRWMFAICAGSMWLSFILHSTGVL